MRGPSGVKEEKGGPRKIALQDFMPRKVVLSNQFAAWEEEDEEIVCEVAEVDGREPVAGVVEVMVDSGASRSVWPRAMKGVVRSPGGGGEKLVAANGSPIKVEGQATLRFKRGRRRCEMRFPDADVRKPLGAVSAVVDGGNTVVFGKKESFIRNDTTGETIPLVRKGGVYVMRLEVEEPEGGGAATVGEVAEGKKEGERLVFVGRLSEEDMGVFRRQA